MSDAVRELVVALNVDLEDKLEGHTCTILFEYIAAGACEQIRWMGEILFDSDEEPGPDDPNEPVAEWLSRIVRTRANYLMLDMVRHAIALGLPGPPGLADIVNPKKLAEAAVAAAPLTFALFAGRMEPATVERDRVSRPDFDALDFLANARFQQEMRAQGFVAGTRWWCTREATRAHWRAVVSEEIRQWANEERAAIARNDPPTTGGPR